MEVRGQQPAGADEAKARFHRLQRELDLRARTRLEQARRDLRNLPPPREQETKAPSQATGAQGKTGLSASGAGSASTHPERAASKTNPRRDKIELSSAAQAAQASTNHGRAQQLEGLRVAFKAGKLTTPERVQRAAVRILSGPEGTQ